MKIATKVYDLLHRDDWYCHILPNVGVSYYRLGWQISEHILELAWLFWIISIRVKIKHTPKGGDQK